VRLGPIVDAVAKELKGQLKVAKVNVRTDPATTSTYRIRAIPTLLVFKDGDVAASDVGYKTKEELLEFVKPHLESK
jgi:thioredoxin 1